MADNFRKSYRWRQERKLAIRLSNGDCYICSGKFGPLDPTIKDHRNPFFVEVDHIIPASKGGALFEQSNLAAVHKICNGKKGDRSLYDMAVKRAIELSAEASKQIVPSGIDWLEEVEDDAPEEET